MRVCVLHGARDLRLEEREAAALGPSQVRLRFGAGGICGSDLHYYGEGRVGDFALREPLILGHEVAGEVIEIGRDVGRVRPGDRVAVNPSLPCWQCRACQAGRTNLCRADDLPRQRGGVPHVQGAFQEQLVVRGEPVLRRAARHALWHRGARRAARGLPARGAPRGRPARPPGADHRLAARSARSPASPRSTPAPPGSPSRTWPRRRSRSPAGSGRTRPSTSPPSPRGSRPIRPTRAGSTWPSRRPATRRRSPPASTACARAGGSCSSACCRPVRVGAAAHQAHAQGDRPGRQLPLPRRVRRSRSRRWSSGRLDALPLLTGTFSAAERDAAFAAALDRTHHMKVQLVFDRA